MKKYNFGVVSIILQPRRDTAKNKVEVWEIQRKNGKIPCPVTITEQLNQSNHSSSKVRIIRYNKPPYFFGLFKFEYSVPSFTNILHKPETAT